MRYARAFLEVLLFVFCTTAFVTVTSAQTGGNASAIDGTVSDPSGAVVPNATVTIHNPVSGLERSATTDSSGAFSFTNVPFNPYHLSVNANGFSNYSQDVEVRSSVPANVKISLQVAGASTTVTVESGGDLVENDSTSHVDIDRQLFNEVPLESASSSISALVTQSSPGVAADSNGLFHGLGDHAENSFAVDGQPITDQQSKVFSNQIPMSSIQSLEVIDGAPPAEYGGKTSLVIDVTTRSGQGVTTPHGSATAAYGTFGTVNGGFDLAYGGQKWGNFISLDGLNTSRFLDPPEFVVMHDKGNEENFFDRADFQISTADSLHLNLGASRSWFQTPNSYDSQFASAWNGNIVSGTPAATSNDCVIAACAQTVGSTDQRSQIRTFNIAPTWNHVMNANTVFTLGAFLRHDEYNYYPSDNPFADLQPGGLQEESVSQLRFLTNAGVRSSVSYVKGVNNIKAGVTYEQTFLTENDRLAIVDPTFGAMLGCENPDGTPMPNTACAFDLTNGGGLFRFRGHTDVKELALYVQDTITKGSWNFNLGIRGDLYNGLSKAQQAEPRLGIAYNIKPSNTVLRVSYARTLETPFNENLVLSSIGCANPVLNPLLACSSSALTPLNPGFRNEFHAGLQQAFGKHVVFDGEYIWKYTHNGYDFSILGNTPITFPVEWHNSKIPGFTARVNLTNLHGFTAYVVMSSVAARFFTPQIGGAGAVPSSIGAFRIDHDEKFNETTHLQYQPWARGPWIGFNWRYDSGLVAGPAPCAGGNCNNGPSGTDTVVDATGISPDQQFQAGLFCGSSRPTHPTAANPAGTPFTSVLGDSFCPATMYGSSLLQIPAPGTEDDDHNPPRIAPRSLFDLSVGEDNLFHGDKYKWSLRLTAINVANKYALYNFISTFSGTHYVTPRALTAEIGFHF